MAWRLQNVAKRSIECGWAHAGGTRASCLGAEIVSLDCTITAIEGADLIRTWRVPVCMASFIESCNRLSYSLEDWRGKHIPKN